ncbi:MAG: Holliday junction branch migration protein RuvA [Chloroflexota bacterium]|nr:Holliday junction branch migration protein RuvA [Chloroflexota bacterium]
MIAGLRGRLDATFLDALLIEVGGVIYRVGTSRSTLDEIGEVGETIRLHTFLFVREDQLTLYGFSSTEELRLFETLITVSGVGPRLACAILSRVQTNALLDTIASENAELLATVPGVGKKTAARLILELRGKLVSLGPLAAATPATRESEEVVAALRALGYTTAEAHQAAARVPKDASLSIEERVVAALREMDDVS